MRRNRGSDQTREAFTATADARRAQIGAMLADDAGATLIADTLGCSRQEVYRLKKCNGLFAQQEYTLSRACVDTPMPECAREPAAVEPPKPELPAEDPISDVPSAADRLLARLQLLHESKAVVRPDVLPPRAGAALPTVAAVVELAAYRIGNRAAREAFLSAQASFRGG